MARLLVEIVAYLAAQTGWTVEADLFAYGFPPQGADTAVALLDGPGRPEAVRPLAELGDFDVQVISRSRQPAEAAQRADTVMVMLHGLTVTDLGTWLVQYAVAVQTPYPMGYDSRGRYEYVNHYRIRATAGS